MKIYLAARYSRFKELQQYRDDLVRDGHTVTSRWINGDHALDDENLTGNPELARTFAEEDYVDLLEAHCIVSFTEKPYTISTRGGRHVEFGLAIAHNKLAIVVGHHENIFHFLPEVEFHERWETARTALLKRL